MINEVYTLKYYTDERNKEPFNAWLDSLEKTDRARVRARLDRVILGNVGDCTSVGDEVFELRFKNHSGFRIYFGYDGDTIVILLSGGNKGSQKDDIPKAKYYWNDYNKRKAGV